MPVRRDAALPGSGLSKKWPHRTETEENGGDKTPAGDPYFGDVRQIGRKEQMFGIK
jgi:hypothetical protein